LFSRKHSFWNELPTSAFYCNSELFLRRRADTFWHKLHNSRSISNAKLLLPNRQYPFRDKLYSGAYLRHSYLFLPIWKHFVRHKLSSTGLYAAASTRIRRIGHPKRTILRWHKWCAYFKSLVHAASFVVECKLFRPELHHRRPDMGRLLLDTDMHLDVSQCLLVPHRLYPFRHNLLCSNGNTTADCRHSHLFLPHRKYSFRNHLPSSSYQCNGKLLMQRRIALRHELYFPYNCRDGELFLSRRKHPIGNFMLSPSSRSYSELYLPSRKHSFRDKLPAADYRSRHHLHMWPWRHTLRLNLYYYTSNYPILGQPMWHSCGEGAMIRNLIAVLLLIFSTAIHAGDCRITGTVCSDATSCKSISGVSICLAGVTPPAGGMNISSSCWQYTDTYECLKPAAVDYCASISATPGCNITSSTCSTTAFNGTCMIYMNTYKCGTSITSTAGVVQLSNNYTITYDQIDRSQCQSYQDNPSCQLSQKICTDGPGTKNINGLDVYKDCWTWKEDYNCIVSNQVDYCSPLKMVGCTVQGQTCTKTATTGECMEKNFQYLCANKVVDPLPTNVVPLSTSYTIVQDTTNTQQCQDLDSNPNCTVASQRCVDGPGTKNINGLDVYKDCWQWEKQYACAGQTLTSTCAELKNNPLCKETGSTCVDTLPGGQCGLLEHQYKCAQSAPATSTQTDCGSQLFCIEGKCFDTGHKPDGDFGKAVSSLEAVREAASYSLFKGEGSHCSSNSISNCCKSSGGGQSASNSAVAQQVGAAAFKAGAETIRVYGSQYVYEALMNSGSTMLAEYAASAAVTGGALSGVGSFSVWGAEFSVTAANGISFVGFDPYSLMASVAIYVIMDLMKCDQEEELLAMRRGQGLCTKTGSYCSSKFLGVCLVKKEGWCCFPSKLGRIVNEQGRPQIGKGWGSGESPDCSGFTQDELAKLKFDQMNFSEFIAGIPVPSKTSSYAFDRLETKAKSYYAP